jgi:small basic protein (TIGR04137 family)
LFFDGTRPPLQRLGEAADFRLRSRRQFNEERTPARSPAGVETVTIDKSLKRKGRLARSRNVLKRDERIEQMKADEKWHDGQSPLGIPKTRVMKIATGKKKKKVKEEEGTPAKGAKGAGKAAPGKKK